MAFSHQTCQLMVNKSYITVSYSRGGVYRERESISVLGNIILDPPKNIRYMQTLHHEYFDETKELRAKNKNELEIKVQTQLIRWQNRYQKLGEKEARELEREQVKEEREKERIIKKELKVAERERKIEEKEYAQSIKQELNDAERTQKALERKILNTERAKEHQLKEEAKLRHIADKEKVKNEKELLKKIKATEQSYFNQRKKIRKRLRLDLIDRQVHWSNSSRSL